MAKQNKAQQKRLAQREGDYNYIVQRFTKDKLTQAEVRLCGTCQKRYCLLLPLTREGKDCPYHQRRATATEVDETYEAAKADQDNEARRIDTAYEKHIQAGY